MAKARKVRLFIGTQKGAFIFSSSTARKQWSPRGPLLKGAEVNDMMMDTRGKPTLYACASGYWWGSDVHISRDGGTSWEGRNKNVLADFNPEKYSEAGQCVHHLTSHPSMPDVLYQQNHCGVYRCDNGGKEWTDISKGLPSRFGFPMQIHPRDPDTVFVIPEEGGSSARRRPGGSSCTEAQTEGRRGSRSRRGSPAGHRFCMSTGRQWLTTSWSRDNGNSWRLLAEHLPQIFSLSCAVA